MLIKSKTLELSKKRNTCCKTTYKKHTYQTLKRYLHFWLCNGQKPGKCDGITLQFFAFLIVVRKNKSHFWNAETKIDKMGMFCKDILNLEIWPNLTLFDLKLTFPRVKFRNECGHGFLRPKWPIKHVRTTLMHNFDWWPYLRFWPLTFIWPDLDFDLYLV